jgi:hypothetical protein
MMPKMIEPAGDRPSPAVYLAGRFGDGHRIEAACAITSSADGQVLHAPTDVMVSQPAHGGCPGHAGHVSARR